MCNYSFFIGSDISKAVIDVSYYSNGKSVYLGQYFNSKKGFEKAFNHLSRKTDISSDQWFVCFENTGAYSKPFLQWLINKGIPCREENPIKISRSLGMRRGKNDKIDSKDICQYAFEKRDSIQPTQLDKPLITKLKSLLARRDLLVKQKSALKVSLNEQKLSMDAILYEELQSENINLILLYEKQITFIETKIQELIETDPAVNKNDKLARSIIGIGPITSAYIISRTNNFTTFTNPRKFACYCGVAPFSNSSGTRHGRMKVNHMANKKLKSLFSNCIGAAIVHDPEISKYFKRKKAEGKKTGIVLNAVKNKLIQRVFAVVKRQTPYVKLMNYT